MIFIVNFDNKTVTSIGGNITKVSKEEDGLHFIVGAEKEYKRKTEEEKVLKGIALTNISQFLKDLYKKKSRGKHYITVMLPNVPNIEEEVIEFIKESSKSLFNGIYYEYNSKGAGTTLAMEISIAIQ